MKTQFLKLGEALTKAEQKQIIGGYVEPVPTQCVKDDECFSYQCCAKNNCISMSRPACIM